MGFYPSPSILSRNIFDEYTYTVAATDACVLRDLGLDKYIVNENVTGVAKEGQPLEAQRKWREGDKLAISDAESKTRMMIHISHGGATTV